MTTNTARPNRLVYTLLLLAIIAMAQLVLIVFLEKNSFNNKIVLKGGYGVPHAPILDE